MRETLIHGRTGKINRAANVVHTIDGQIFEYAGFVCEQGSFDPTRKSDDHIVIITYRQSFEQHKKSHADHIFKEKFDQLAQYCPETYELGYNMLWQGTAGE